jgi:hypothetical protein
MTKGAAVDLHQLPAVAFKLDMAPMLLRVGSNMPYALNMLLCMPAIHGAAIDSNGSSAAKLGAAQVTTTYITIDAGHGLCCLVTHD